MYVAVKPMVAKMGVEIESEYYWVECGTNLEDLTMEVLTKKDACGYYGKEVPEDAIPAYLRVSWQSCCPYT